MSVMDRLFGGYWRPEPRHEHQWETIKEVEVERLLGEIKCAAAEIGRQMKETK